MTLEPLQLLPATLSGIGYAVRADHLRRTPRAVPGWRQGCFYGGLVVIVGALTLTGKLAEQLFAVHMIEHLVLADVGALLLVLGLTGPVLVPILRIRALAWLRGLAHPLVAMPLWAISLTAWHIPVLHEAAVRDATVHALQHACFIGFGANVWMALLGPLPKPAWFGNAAKLGYILGVRAFGAILANVFVFGGGAFYAVYAPGERAHGISPASDQVTAGTVMMVWESVLTLGLFCWLFLRAGRETEERQELLDLAVDRGFALTDERAARAVAAGRGDELRRRIEGSAAPLPSNQA